MPLVRIEVCDFKSYRGHQVLGPFSAFTSVIGPNGAGKSNLMDAISFVLGIKSSQLRSSQLKDLVYRGRKLAADHAEEGFDAEFDEEDKEMEKKEKTKRAWVLAVFEDLNKKEWRFKRTISTTGSSEYHLNSKTVSYSAYTEALSSHNIIVKAKNFLVFQGDVEAVASQSPIALTRLIEQISGSLELTAEYERARAAQERATENATFNFNRRRGIAGEIKQYKEQKTEAERFEALCEQRDDLILKRILYKLFHIEESVDNNTREIRDRSKSVAGLRQEQEAHDAALEATRAEQARARSAAMKEEKRIKKTEKALEAKRPDLTSIEAQMAHSKRKLEAAEKNRQLLKMDLETQQNRLDSRKEELNNVKAAAEDAQEQQRRVSQRNMQLSEDALQQYRRLKAAASVLAVDERQSLDTLMREEKTIGRNWSQLHEQFAEFQNQRDTLEGEANVWTKKKSELEEKVASLQAQLTKSRQDLEHETSERTRIANLEAEVNERLAEVMQKLLQAGVEKDESDKEVRLKETVVNLQRMFPGVRGRFVDLCKPTQRKYEVAISVVLGRNIDAIVVDEEKTAIDCIEYMRNQRSGQAMFIPLDTIQVKPINDKYRAFAKGARLAVDVIQFEQAVERAMHYACGNALVCDSMDVAKFVCWEKGQEVKAVTLEGTVIHKSGLMTGGRSTHGTGMKWDEKDIQGYRRTQDALQSQLRDLAKSKPKPNTEQNITAEIGRLSMQLTIARDDLSACKLRLNGINDMRKHVQNQIKETKPALEKAQVTYDSLKERINASQTAITAAEDQIFSQFCAEIDVSNIREYEESQLKLAQEQNEVRLQFDKQIQRLTHQCEFEDENMNAISERLAHLDAVVDKENGNLVRLEGQKTEVEQEVQESEKELSELHAKLKALEEARDKKTKELEHAKRNALKASKSLEQALKEISSWNDENEKLGLERSSLYRKCRLEEIKLPLLEGTLRNVPMEENLREEVAMDVDEDEDGMMAAKPIPNFGIEVDFESLDDEDNAVVKAQELDSSVSKLNADIERMAPNMKAMRRLEDVEVKLAETEKEADKARKDSRVARDEFNDVKRRRCELFNKAYNHISDQIDQVYKDLTKGKASPMGGVAYLSLEDSEEPYAGGIKYHAMPPMKRFRDMEQLSGGEKTVAALALLFAIHSYQPAPFFILDEVDAALDNVNVAKIANYIRSRASNAFQFIVISLKASFYERGNSLIGIYRDQSINSSRTLTLDLTKYDE